VRRTGCALCRRNFTIVTEPFKLALMCIDLESGEAQ